MVVEQRVHVFVVGFPAVIEGEDHHCLAFRCGAPVVVSIRNRHDLQQSSVLFLNGIVQRVVKRFWRATIHGGVCFHIVGQYDQ